MHLVQLLLPVRDNSGRDIPEAYFAQVRDELTARFGGVTAYVRSPAQGVWRTPAGGAGRDDIVMCEVMVERLDRAWWAAYREELERRFAQHELVARALAMQRL